MLKAQFTEKVSTLLSELPMIAHQDLTTRREWYCESTVFCFHYELHCMWVLGAFSRQYYVSLQSGMSLGCHFHFPQYACSRQREGQKERSTALHYFFLAEEQGRKTKAKRIIILISYAIFFSTMKSMFDIPLMLQGNWPQAKV